MQNFDGSLFKLVKSLFFFEFDIEYLKGGVLGIGEAGGA